MAVTAFDSFCLAHSCATWCRGRPDYCPLADEIREEHDGIDGRHCEEAWERMMGITRPAEAPVASGFRPRRRK